MTLEENIKNWIKLDNQIKELSSQLKELRAEKDIYNKDILQHIEENNLENAVIKIGNGRLKFIESNNLQPLTYKFISECLCDYFEDEPDVVMEIIHHIKSKRNIKTTREIKRYNVSS